MSAFACAVVRLPYFATSHASGRLSPSVSASSIQMDVTLVLTPAFTETGFIEQPHDSQSAFAKSPSVSM